MQLVSVILPTYNRAQLVGDAVRSVLEQTYPHWELIIVDDGSTDGTKDVLKPLIEDPRIRYVPKSNGGAASARNAGIGLATGALVAFIDSDDTWNANKLEVQVDALRRCPDVGIVCSDFSALSERDGLRERSHIKSYFSVFQDYGLGYSDVFAKETEVQNAASSDRFKVYSGNIYETMVFGNLILTSTTLIRKSALDAVGDFDTSYSTLEDYDLLLRLTKMFDVAFVDMPLLLYRYNEGQLSGEKHFERLCHNLDEIFEKNVRAMGPRFVEANRARIRRHRGMIQSQLGYYYANHGQKQRAAHHYRQALARGGLSVRNIGFLTFCYLPDSAIAGLKAIKNTLAGRARSHGG